MRFHVPMVALLTALLASCGAEPVALSVDGGIPGGDGGGCTTDAQCSDGVFCNGAERCVASACVAAAVPACPGMSCNELTETCGAACATDADGDGACAGEDCDDNNPARFLGAIERCDTIDQDCNPVTLGPDADGDGLPSTECCNPQAGGARLCGTDCDDTRDTIKPSAVESCNTRDDNCDGTVDEGVQQTFYRDLDGDGFGDPTMPVLACTAPAGYVMATNVNECAAAVNPCGVGTCTDLPSTYRCACPADYVEVTTPVPSCAWDVAALADLGTSTGVLSPYFAAGTTSYTMSIPLRVESMSLTPVLPAGFAGTVLVQGQSVAIGQSSAALPLPLGSLDVSIVVRAASGRTQTYAVRAARGFGAGTYVKASNTGTSDQFGFTVALSADGSTLAVGAVGEDSNAMAIGGNQADNTLINAGAVYVFRRSGSTWMQEAYVKASNPGTLDNFGIAVALSADGSTLAVGSQYERSSATGINGNQADESALYAGAVYVFRRSASTWAQEAYVKASNTGTNDIFGYAVALSSDGNTMAVGAIGESSNATGVGGNQADNSAVDAGAAYVFRRMGTAWAQDAYVKASNTGASDRFGGSVALSADGSTLAVGAGGEDSRATGVGGDQADDSISQSGAAYVFRRAGSTWAQEAYVKASNAGGGDLFGNSVALSADGTTLAVGAPLENSNAVGVGGDQTSSAASDAGAVYVFRRVAGAWAQEAYVKASNTGAGDNFGIDVALSADGAVLAVGGYLEDSNGASQSDESAMDAGAAYVFRRTGGVWAQQAYVKASNAGVGDRFGRSIALTSDGGTLAIGAWYESSSATGINGNQNDDSAGGAGAVYVRDTFVGPSVDRYVKASNTGAVDRFGYAVALSADGATLAVGAVEEDSRATGVNGEQSDNSASAAGAVYVFRRRGSTWVQEAYVKASNAASNANFGASLALSGDGSVLAVGATGESSTATGINGIPTATGASASGAAYVFRRTGSTWAQEAYVKASNTGAGDNFGRTIALSTDGATLAVGAPLEDSSARDVGGAQADESAVDAGAVYVFRMASGTWTQEAYVKASNTGAGDNFGYSVALSADGATLATGAPLEDSAAVGVAGNQADESASAAGAVYLFRRTGNSWAREAYVKASSTGAGDNFGWAVALSGDGATLAAGAPREDSSARGVGGDEADNSATNSGAAYVFRRPGSTWAQDAYLKASPSGGNELFGSAVALSADGSILTVGAWAEDSSATGVGGNQADNTANDSGASYVLRRAGNTWASEAYVKAPNTGMSDQFGFAVALSADGSTLAVGATREDSAATGVQGNQADEAAMDSGAVYTYRY